MIASARGSVVLGCLVLLLCLTGCRKQAGPMGAPPVPSPAPPAPNPPPPSQPIIAPVGTTGPGVFKTISAANRDALAHDLKQIGIAYMTAAAGGQPPRKAEELGQEMRKQIQ